MSVLTEQLVVEFSPVKKELRRTLQQLQAAEQTQDVRNAIAKLEQTIVDLNDVCGTTMVIPITAR